MPIIEQIPGRTIVIDGEQWLYFSGTSYLGISALPAFRELLQESIEQYGTNYGGSRLANIQFKAFLDAEALLANLSGAPAALTVSSGTLAANWVMQHLQAQAHPIYYAPEVHPALHWNQRPTSHSRKDWEQKIIEKAKQERTPAILISNGIDPLRVKAYDFSWLTQLPNDISYTLVIDDSHVFGVLGEAGGGSFRLLNLPDNVQLIVVGSLGKAWGIPGGVILADQRFIADLRQSSLFGGASPAIPAYLDAFVHAQDLYARQRIRLKENIRLFTAMLGERQPFSQIPAFPVFYSPDQQLARKLEQKRILISSFPYPSPDSELITRIVLNALHRDGDLSRLVAAIFS